jgi:hypothetical protein
MEYCWVSLSEIPGNKNLNLVIRCPDEICPEFWGLVIRYLIPILDKLLITRPLTCINRVSNTFLLKCRFKSIFLLSTNDVKGTCYPESWNHRIKFLLVGRVLLDWIAGLINPDFNLIWWIGL